MGGEPRTKARSSLRSWTGSGRSSACTPRILLMTPCADYASSCLEGSRLVHSCTGRVAPPSLTSTGNSCRSVSRKFSLPRGVSLGSSPGVASPEGYSLIPSLRLGPWQHLTHSIGTLSLGMSRRMCVSALMGRCCMVSGAGSMLPWGGRLSPLTKAERSLLLLMEFPPSGSIPYRALSCGQSRWSSRPCPSQSCCSLIARLCKGG